MFFRIVLMNNNVFSIEMLVLRKSSDDSLTARTGNLPCLRRRLCACVPVWIHCRFQGDDAVPKSRWSYEDFPSNMHLRGPTDQVKSMRLCKSGTPIAVAIDCVAWLGECPSAIVQRALVGFCWQSVS